MSHFYKFKKFGFKTTYADEISYKFGYFKKFNVLWLQYPYI